MQPTISAKKKLLIKKELKNKSKKKLNLSVDILIHQHMSICIRRYRYNFEPEKELNLFGIGNVMKKIYYTKFKEEISELQAKMEEQHK